jgi:hypothetical protein
MKILSFVFILTIFTADLFSQENIVPIDTVKSFSRANIFPIDKETGKITYSEIIKVDSINSQELYLRAKVWFVHSFVSAKNVIQLDDKESGKIIGKGLFDVKSSIVKSQNVGYVEFTIEIQVKDGRYKYTFSDISHKSGTSGILTPEDLRLEKPGGGLLTMGMKNWQGIKQQTHETVMNMIESLKKAMGTKNDLDKW